MKTSKILYPIFLSMALVLGIGIGAYFDFPVQSVAIVESGEREGKLRQIINYIDYEYVDDVNTDSLLDLTITGLLKRLDPHSVYIPQDLVSQSEEGIRGSFDGIGIEFKIFRDTLTVVHTIDGGPSDKAGIVEGDRILTAGEKVLFGNQLSSNEILSTLKGESGTWVALNVYRPGNKSTSLITVKRGSVPVKSLQSSFILDNDIGYLKLIRFSQTSSDEVEDAIRRLKREGASRFILDLRENPGGLLMAAQEVADQFLEDDKLIVFTKNRQGDVKRIYATSSGRFERGDLVVLINEGSASASEIVAGAIQDNDRGWIIGRRSFGKGLVQEEMTLEDGSKIRLTTRRYFTPSGRSIQKPFEDYDQQFLGDEEYQASVADQSSAGKSYTTSGGRVVYGGGGIRPDVEVAMDTGHAAAFVYHLALVTNFDEKAFSYVDKNREALSEWSRDAFVRDFVVDDELLEYFFGRFMDKIAEQPEYTRELVVARTKAYIAYNLYGDGVFQEIYASYDPMVRQALSTLNDSTGVLK